MILYRTSGPWGGGVGANLTAAQVDGNFYDVSMRVQYLELNPPTAVQIASFSSIGNQLYVHMTDGTVNGPLTLPTVRWNFRGNWTPVTTYLPDDVVVAPDSAIYIVAFTHTSATSFSPGANDGQAHNYYLLLLRVPGLTIPQGGSRGSVLTKNTDNNYDMSWTMAQPPEGGYEGQVLRKFSDTSGDAGWRDFYLFDLVDAEQQSYFLDGDYIGWSWSLGGRWTNIRKPGSKVVKASSWAPVIGDDGTFVVLTNGPGETTIYIPPDDEQDFPIGTELHIHQDGTGKVTVVGDSSPSVPVTVLRHASFTNVLLGQYATATVKKTAFNEWRLFGLLAAAI